jgi:hypothetical protein
MPGQKTTRHTCGGPVFGQKTPGCPRCDELLAGAEPVRWAWTERRRGTVCGHPLDYGEWGAYCRRCEIAHHDCKRSNCGPVCTFGDW